MDDQQVRQIAAAAFRELCGIVDEWLEVIRDEDGALPEPTAS